MAEIKFETLENEPAAFNLYDAGKKIGEMIVEIKGKDMTVFHTEVDEDQGGKGYAGMLLQSMVTYVRENHLKVIPMCSFVHLQFDRHPDLYKDIRSDSKIKF
ncbi:GNAT family N-acetyltransferase [Pedobacter sp. L105]|uniref:GNAT family N-acetyltransferase n=1 Tax=Pedobacter sp. L105 TaxID=1641871 RepID=UPI00131AD417|nr:GNAT family N-acetyltransferase [Pedobacter sp. L105]